MIPLFRFSLFLLCCFASGGAAAQAPTGAPSHSAADHPPLPKPSNLKVLPADIPIPKLVETMIGFSQQLGVECVHCHVAKPGVDPNYDLNFASDANPKKGTARIMLTMVAEINRSYIASVPEPHQGQPVTCGTCHRGNFVPQAFVPPAQPAH